MKASPVQWPLLYSFGRRVPCPAQQRGLFGRHPVPSGRAGPSGANVVGYHIRSLSIPGVYASFTPGECQRISRLRRCIMGDQIAPAELTSADHRRRMQAIYRLVEQHPPQAGIWIRPLLKDREALVRSAAIVALGDLQDQESFADLVACLAAPTSHEQRNAVRALVGLGGERMRDPLLQALSQKADPFVCFDIIKGLSAFADDGDVVDALIQQLQAPDEDVRATAAVALAKMRARAAVPALQHMMQTDSNQETSIHGLWVANSSVAKMAIAMILSGQQASALDWPS